MFQVNRKIFAVTLSFGKNGTSNTAPTMSIFMRSEGKFYKVYQHLSSKFLKKIDCSATEDAGFVAVVNNINSTDMEPDQLFQESSLVLRVTLQPSGEPKFEVFQKFAMEKQNNARLWSRGNRLYLIFSYDTHESSQVNICTVFKLAETHFVPMDNLPCQNARVVEFFAVHHDLMVLIGNYRENNGTTNTFSSIMRYDLNQQRFVEHQKILTNAIAVGRYFFLDHHEQRQHFLFIGNSFEVSEFGVTNYDIPSMIYKMVNGFFIPMQTINVKYVKAVLPILVSLRRFSIEICLKEN